jgi:hypothetical protein
LEQARRERETVPDEIETHHPGYLLPQDTFYVGYMKGVGRIYQQTVIDTYSSVAFAKLYNFYKFVRSIRMWCTSIFISLYLYPPPVG